MIENTVIYEYENIQDESLKRNIVETSKLHKYFKLEWKTLKSQQFCGILNFDNQDIYLLPKIAKDSHETNLDTFIYMLMYAFDIKINNEDIASCKNHKHTILEVFIQMFAKHLLQELQKGVYKNYITCKDNLTTLRGKYLINENLKYNFKKNKIYCEYDEFSMDNELNQFFLYALRVLLPFAKNKQLLKKCELIFDEVEYKMVDIKTLHVNFNRLNLRFKESFEFALLLLNQSTPLFEKDKKSFAFLFDMNILFEKFVGKMIKELYPQTKLQSCDSFGDMMLKPDIILDELIIDTKYKKASHKRDIKREDKFQMYAYAKNYHLNTTMLLYPKHLESFNCDLVLGFDKVQLKIKNLDLHVKSCDYKSYISEMKKRIEEIVR